MKCAYIYSVVCFMLGFLVARDRNLTQVDFSKNEQFSVSKSQGWMDPVTRTPSQALYLSLSCSFLLMGLPCTLLCRGRSSLSQNQVLKSQRDEILACLAYARMPQSSKAPSFHVNKGSNGICFILSVNQQICKII